MVRICTGNTASLRKWFRGLTCGSRSCGGEEAGCFGGGSQHGVTFYVVSLRKYVLKEKVTGSPEMRSMANEREAITTVGRAR